DSYLRIPHPSSASSAAQSSGVNDDYYVHYYIQQQNTSIAQSETFLSSHCTGVKTMPAGLLQLIRVGL
ncbi:hypothetical protein M9458_015839, partial [Cirrhinus mrigala]